MATYNDAITGAHRSLNDSAKTRYPDSATFPYAQDAIREIAMLRPDLFTLTGTINCTAGTVEQTLPAGGLYVIDIHGVVGGRAVTKGDLKTLARYRRDWRTDTAGPCENWFPIIDDQTKRPQPKYLIYPKAPAAQQLTAQYAYDPIITSPPTSVNDTMPVPDQFLPAVESYIIFRCEMADDEHVTSGRAQAAYTNFATIIGVDEKTRKMIVIEGRQQ
ncbi:MAG TPA: hypothetical protein PKV98_04590 [Burkholderiaceae bacterium]|nr:hypothetical protein [Burkholderiaceae bacterium]